MLSTRADIYMPNINRNLRILSVRAARNNGSPQRYQPRVLFARCSFDARAKGTREASEFRVGSINHYIARSFADRHSNLPAICTCTCNANYPRNVNVKMFDHGIITSVTTSLPNGKHIIGVHRAVSPVIS